MAGRETAICSGLSSIVATPANTMTGIATKLAVWHHYHSDDEARGTGDESVLAAWEDARRNAGIVEQEFVIDKNMEKLMWSMQLTGRRFGATFFVLCHSCAQCYAFNIESCYPLWTRPDTRPLNMGVG